MELSLNRDLLGNPIGGQMKNDIPSWGRVEHHFSGAGLPLDSLYGWDILSSIRNTRQLCARSERSDYTNHRLSIFGLKSISVRLLQYLRYVVRQLRCFLGLLLTVTSDQNSVYFSKAASTVSQSCKGQQPFNLAVPSHKWKLNLTHTTLWPYMFLSCLFNKTATAAWETGSPRPSDNLLLY